MTQYHFNFKKLFIMTVTTGALLTTVFLGQGMAARDGKAYSGWSCKPWTLPNANANFKYDNWGRIQNTSTTEHLNVLCPIVRDTMAASNKLDSVSVEFYNNNPRNANSQARCAIRKYHSTGQFIKLVRSGVTYKSSVPPSTPVQEWEKTQHMWLQTNEAQGAGTYYVLSCSLPPKQDGKALYLTNYYVVELG